MPNHTTNILEAPGHDDVIKLIEPYMGSNNSDSGRQWTLDLNKIIPMPPELEGTESPRDKPNWYDWRVENWGTKWNTYDPDLDPENPTDQFKFYTAWAPPIPCIVKLATLVKATLVLYYLDEGGGFIGKLTANPDGTHEDECYGDVDAAPEAIREYFGDLLQTEE